MEVKVDSNVVNNYIKNEKVVTEKKEKVDEVKNQEKEKDTVKTADYYEKQSEKPKPVNYEVDTKKIQQLKMDFEERQASLIKMVQGIIKGQVGSIEEVIQKLQELKEGKGEISLDVSKQAELEIGEDGYWGVEKTADRIIEFAKAISGGDPSKLELLKDAVKKGFDMAEETLGELPEISKKTYTRVMEKFDEWEKGDK